MKKSQLKKFVKQTLKEQNFYQLSEQAGSATAAQLDQAFQTPGDSTVSNLDPYNTFGDAGSFNFAAFAGGFVNKAKSPQRANKCNFVKNQFNVLAGKVPSAGSKYKAQLLIKMRFMILLASTPGNQELPDIYGYNSPNTGGIGCGGNQINQMQSTFNSLASEYSEVSADMFENKKITNLRNTIREELNKLKEIENVSGGGKCRYTNSGGAEETGNPNYCPNLGEECEPGSDTERCICDCTGGSNPGVLRNPRRPIRKLMKKENKTMKLTQLKNIIKEEIQNLQEQALSNWDGNCGNVIPNNSADDLKNLCMKCSPELTGGENSSYDQTLNPSPCDCNLNGMPLMDFCRNKFPSLYLGSGSNTSGGSTSIKFKPGKSKKK